MKKILVSLAKKCFSGERKKAFLCSSLYSFYSYNPYYCYAMQSVLIHREISFEFEYLPVHRVSKNKTRRLERTATQQANLYKLWGWLFFFKGIK